MILFHKLFNTTVEIALRENNFWPAKGVSRVVFLADYKGSPHPFRVSFDPSVRRVLD
jgi:hypothetical protein